MNARGDTGFMASERPGGFGGLDIYQLSMPPRKDFEEIAYVRGRVLDEVTKKPVEAVVYISEKGNYNTDQQGRFFICHPTLSELKVLVSERKYLDYTNNFKLTNWNEEGFVEIDIYLRPLNAPMNVAALGEKELIPKGPERTPEKITPVQRGPVEKKTELPVEEIHSTHDVFFYFDDFTLTREARYNLSQIVNEIEEDKLALIIIEGYADQIGTDDYNQRLSEKRAEEVAAFFKSKGITNLKIKYKGYGERQSSVTYANNRKVEIFVYYKLNY